MSSPKIYQVANLQTTITNVYNQANSAYSAANTASSTGGGGYDQANTARNQANTAYAQANSARDQANTAYGQANTARGTANDAYAQANSGYLQANNAYLAANNSNLKLGGIITGTLNVTQDIIVGGNVYLQGNTTYINVATYQVNDPLMYVAANNSLTDSVDIGFIGGKNTSGTYSHTGFARDATDGKYKLFDGLPEEGHIGNVINFANTFLATLVANVEANTLSVINGVSGNVNFDSGTLFIDATGNKVGIGTSTPAANLHVYSSTQSAARFESSQSEVNIRFDNSGATTNLFGVSGANFYWYSGSTERMRLDSSGNLGLGVTPSTAWQSTKRAFQFGLTGGLYGTTNDTPVALTTNTYYNGTNWVALQTSPSSKFELADNVFKWWAAPSVGGGVNQTFTQVMTLTAAGELLVGNTSAFWGRSGSAAFYNPTGSYIALVRDDTTMVADEILGGYEWGGADPSNNNSCYIRAYAGGTWSTSDIPSYITFGTTPVGGGGPSERMRIDSSGNLGVNETSPSTYGKMVLRGGGSGSDGGTILAMGPSGMGSIVAGDDLGTISFGGGTASFTSLSAAKIFVEGDATWSSGDYPTRMSFWTTADGASSATERMRIDSSGNVGIGSTNPSRTLDVSGRMKVVAGSAGIAADLAHSVTGASVLQLSAESTSYVDAVIIASSGQSTGSSFYHFYAYRNNFGNLTSYIRGDGNFGSTTNTYGGTSDIRLKSNIIDAGSQWNDIKSLRIRKYTMNNDPTGLVQIGVIAQELENFSPGLVEDHNLIKRVEYVDKNGDTQIKTEKSDETFKTVKYSILYMKAVKALQEAMERIETLEAKMAALESK